MFCREIPLSNNRWTTWNRYVDLPLRRTPMQTAALPGTVSMRKRRGTPVSSRDSWKSRMMDLIVSITEPLLGIILSD